MRSSQNRKVLSCEAASVENDDSPSKLIFGRTEIILGKFHSIAKLGIVHLASISVNIGVAKTSAHVEAIQIVLLKKLFSAVHMYIYRTDFQLEISSLKNCKKIRGPKFHPVCLSFINSNSPD
jgi:hypothetical protein